MQKKPTDNLTLDDRAVIAKTDDHECELLISEYRPFILGRVYNQGFGQEEDDISIALGAFFEAIRTYDKNRGSFLNFASKVIYSRLIDQKRKIQRQSNISLLAEDTDSAWDQFFYRQQKDILESQEMRKNEIGDFVSELTRWGIRLEDLSQSTPRHMRTKKLCGQALGVMLHEDEILAYIKTKHKLPIQEIAGKLKVNVKLLERHRRYLIAAYVVYSGDYTYLREYIPINSMGKEVLP